MATETLPPPRIPPTRPADLARGAALWLVAAVLALVRGSPAAAGERTRALGGPRPMARLAREPRVGPRAATAPSRRRRAPAPRDQAPTKPIGREADKRGREAESPGAIPTRGWLDVARRVIREFGEDQVPLVAAGVTFYALLAIVPALAAMISLYGLMFDTSDVARQIETLEGFLPGGAVEILGDQAARIAAGAGGGLTFGVITGILLALWAASAGIKALLKALNIVYEEEEKRGFVRLTAEALGMTIGAIVLLLLVLTMVAVVPPLLAARPLGGFLDTLVSWARWPILWVLVAGALSLLYRYGPSREPARWSWVTWGSGLAALGWMIVSMLFSWYVANFGNYNATYGTLGAVVGFMTWIWISTMVLLLGAELNSELEHQTARDTTTGDERPLGARGAFMADHVAADQPRS